MINTYQTSVAPPPLPPRLDRSNPVFIQPPLPSQGHSKALIQFLVGVVLLHLLLSVGGFFLLYHTSATMTLPSTEGKEEKQEKILARIIDERMHSQNSSSSSSSKTEGTSSKTLARMIVDKSTRLQNSAGYLKWNIDSSVLSNINYYHNSWLTVLHSGDYFVSSRVTFSKGDGQPPLAMMVKLRENEKGKEKAVMHVHCSLNSHAESATNPQMCTTTEGEVISLNKGNQLAIWVQKLSLVDYSEQATTFGMYKL
ncbi:CD40 ligand [Aulostomus maculatus]